MAETELAARAPAVEGGPRGDAHWLGGAIAKHYNGDDSDLKLLMAGVNEAFEGMSVDDYAASVAAFFAEAEHPTLKRPFRDCAFLPMVELLR